jgi:hypothetical protein
MSDQQCEAVRRWLRQSEPATLPAHPPSELVAHIASCPACRGLLAAGAADLLGVPAARGDLPCDQCQDVLDEYIDCERRQGVAVAVQRYPDVWWHLWTCLDCAEVYDLTNALVDAEEQVGLPIPAAVAPEQPAWHARLPTPPLVGIRLQLPRAFLHSVFAPQAALGGAWSGGEHESLFAEEQLEEYHIALHVRQRSGTFWAIGIAVTPPLAGWAVLSFGELRFRAPFDQHGQATIAEIPLALLTDRAGPDLLMTIEPHDTNA